MKKILKWGGAVIGVALVGMQFIQPDRSTPAFDPMNDLARISATDSSVAAILRRSCYDCHSYQTRWPFYSYIAPASWLVANDVREGRRHVNFSLWGKYADTRKLQSLDDIHDQVSDGGMPLPKYLMLHPGARLSTSDRDAILRWAADEKKRLGGD